MKNYKCIVIGSGPGGATTALEFVKKGIDVLLLEKGSNTPLNKLQEYTSTEMNQKYKNSGLTASMGNHLINYAEGSCLGGGSEVNSGLYHEIPEMILEKWEEKNKIKFDRNELKESYEYVKNILDVSYMPENLIPDASKRLKHGSDKFGWQCSEIPRWYSYKSDPLGKRMSISETLIPEFLQNGGELLESCNVIKVKKGRKNKNIVQVMNANGERFDLQAEFLVIAGGSIDTPNLLLKSGYRHNIGKGLKMHPSFKFTALFDEKINNKNMGVPVHQVKEFSPQISMGCSISSKQFIALGLNDTSNIAHLDSWECMANYYSMICPQGSGSIHRVPFFKSPLVLFNLSKTDRENIIKGAKLLGQILFSAGAKKLFPSISKEIIFENEDDLEHLNNINFKNFNLMTIHLFSSAQIGGDRRISATNEIGQLWGDKSIVISDGSLLCDSPSVNPQATIMAIAKMNSKKLIEVVKKNET